MNILQSIPTKRLIVYLLALGILPLCFVLFELWNANRQLDDLTLAIGEVEAHYRSYKNRQASNLAVMEHYRDADHFYIDKHLETIKLLKPEVEALQSIVNHKNFAGDPVIKKRLDFLIEHNHLVFTEGVVQSYPHYQEVTETLMSPVEVNIRDIKKIIARTEGVEIDAFSPGPNRPHLIIVDYKLDKKRHPNENEVFVMDMKVLKREYL